MVGYFFLLIFDLSKNKEIMYIAVGITKDDYWVCISKPCSYEEAMMFEGFQMANEKFAVKTEAEVNEHKKTLK